MNDIITSVLGFNFNVEIKDQNGNTIKTGAKTIFYKGDFVKAPKNIILDKNFFTHYNDALLAKIRDYRRIND
jgi:hypothetical protein